MAPGFSVTTHEAVARLEESLDSLAAFASMVPAQFTHALPAWSPPDAWTVAMNLAHMTAYEELLAAPVLEALASGGDGGDAAPSGDEGWFLRAATDMASLGISELVGRLRRARQRQVATIHGVTQAHFDEAVCRLWSPRPEIASRSASWVATKTFQHTWEHGNAILRIALLTAR